MMRSKSDREIGSVVKLRTCLREVMASHVSMVGDGSRLGRLELRPREDRTLGFGVTPGGFNLRHKVQDDTNTSTVNGTLTCHDGSGPQSFPYEFSYDL